MRLSHCESHCAGPFHYIPCLPKSKDVSGGASSAAGVVAAAEEQPPPVQKIEAAVARKDDDEKCEDGVKTAAPPTKSSLKKITGGDSKCPAKGNVQWLDLLGKDLTEVKEFEPSECEDSLDDGDGIAACVCVIQ
ncbi:hypothetical protein EJB05_04052 [Eragrostis curvula]|uniref:Uncharacterized protein n=1 Tax=Eragrostis curvula TaxID=38414 RepID=A0A5J9W9M3_9POAL|nr:hypothetical protein EJB05_04052 [Eragrostis curvula]